MTKVLILAALAALLSVPATAVEATKSKYRLTPAQEARVKQFKAKFAGKTPAEIRYIQTGGPVFKPGTGKGKVVVLNAQQLWSKRSVEEFFNEMSLLFFVKIEVLDSETIDYRSLAKTREKCGAVALVHLVNQGEAEPKSLVSYEDSWGIANIGAFAKAPESIRTGRAKRLAFRTFALTCGIGDPKSIGSTMWPARDDLTFDGLYLPDRPLPNLMIPIQNHLSKLGLELIHVRNYRQACQEGWAPVPTNDIQKAIWDKVHQLPTKPIKILPETKPVKE